MFADSRPDDLYPHAIEIADVTRITVTARGDGFALVEGAAGAIPGAFPVYVASPNTGHAALTRATADGRFSTRVVAPPGSWVIVKHDPTPGNNWLYPEILENTRPTPVNAAPGVYVRVPYDLPSGEGTPFVIGGSTFPGHMDFSLAGTMSGSLRAGGRAVVTGRATVYLTAEQARRVAGSRLQLNVQLAPLFDNQGQQRTMADQFYSSILTPTGLPVEHWLGPTPGGAGLASGPLEITGNPGRLEAPFSVELALPKDLPEGTYSLWIDAFNDAVESLAGPRIDVNPFMNNNAISLPPFTIGTPAPPRLVWTLLTDVPSADGSRGTVAHEDESSFQIANRIATQSQRFIIPRVSKLDGKPLTYRLEPYLPMVSHGDRYIPNVPTLALQLPSGSLTVRVIQPDGHVDTLGPRRFAAAATRTPATGAGVTLDEGGGHLAEVFQLTTDSGAFDYEFAGYGEYTIEMSGAVSDVYGNTYPGGGRYTVFVAEPLDLEPATLPMTPFEVGDFLNPGVTVVPGVPAHVEVRVRLLVESDPTRAVQYDIAGTANRYGTFTPAEGSSRIEMSGAGEFVVETAASYTDPDGVLWMGATRWGQVVAPKDSTLIAHGRRDRDDAPVSEARAWFRSPSDGTQGHLNLPFHSGDIAWETDNDSGRVIITVHDAEGRVEESIRYWVRQGTYTARGEHANPRPTLDQRASAGELPLTFATASGINPALIPEDIVAYGYWYGGVERPGERVREMISDDDVGTGYWRFGELFHLQPGMGVAGDLPQDFKFQFGGAVFRDTTRGLNRYGIYGSLWVQIFDDDPIGTRVAPPFQGINGGPSGGPIMRLDGKEIDAFVVPLAVRPGTILEAGDIFSFSAQLAPMLPGRVQATVTGPGRFSRTVSGRASKIGYFYDPAQDFTVLAPGRYHVDVTATFDRPTSAGAMAEPYPTGTVLGAIDQGFDVYVVERSAPLLYTPHPSWSTIRGIDPIKMLVGADALLSGRLLYTVAMPGFLLEAGEVPFDDGRAIVVYDPERLSGTFPNIDVGSGRASYEPGLVDTVWVSVMLEGDDGGFRARQFTLKGPDLLAPETCRDRP